MKTNRAWIVFGALGALTVAVMGGSVYGTWTWQTLDSPGSLRGISGNRILAQGYDGGYLYDGQTWSALPGPRDGTIQVYGIDGNYIVGAAWDSNFIYCSPVMYDGSTWKAIPGASIGVEAGYASGISGKTIIGHYSGMNNRGYPVNTAFITTVDAPWDYDGAVTIPNLPDPYFNGIDGVNIIGRSNNSAFLLKMNPGGPSNWSWTLLGYPGYGAGATVPDGISGKYIVGSLWGGNGYDHGFLYDGKTWQMLDYPGAARTQVTGISGNLIIGGYQDWAGGYHGFILTIPEPATLTLLALCGLLVVRRR